MSNELISKKDLLNLTGISYGQLYRWKRKDLIPEDWFIRKSTYTGQETFFPKAEILERIAKIQTMKENVSLDELADIFSPGGTSCKLNKEELLATGLVSETVIQYYLANATVYQDVFEFNNVMVMYVLEKLLQSGDISLDEGKMIIQLFQDYYLAAQAKKIVLIVIRKMGISSCVIAEKTDVLQFESNTKIVANVDFAQISEELRLKM
ncbi:MAG: YhbD family protein [Lachnospiraceae bacterium]|nr:YhbD family protein [Lachnospiraceae bacterium]